MGWYYPVGVTKKSLIAELTETRTSDKVEEASTITSTCLKHCYRGNSFYGILWCVRETTYFERMIEISRPSRWIDCYILHRTQQGYGWGYKHLYEEMHPFYYSCPLSYLDLVPICPHGGCPEWRDLVVEYHQRILQKRRRRRQEKQRNG